ncbi:MAG: ABC transporter permease [Candidatus Metalachnospira sp.]|nr:ABC transporter permease [Candidatus Metalachnospira sp.]
MNQFKKMAYPYVAWISIMIVAPMLLIVMYAFIKGSNDVTTFRFTLSNFTKFFSDKVYIDVLYRSLYIAVFTTILCLLIGYPAAYIISAANLKNKTWLVLLITFPTWINMLVRTYAWLGILQDDGIVNTVLGLFGIGTVKIIYTNFAVILGMVYNFVPFMILQIYSSLEKMDKSYMEAASDLGANNFECFWKITFPMSLPGVISGITLVFLPAVSSFFIPKLLGGGQFVLIGNVIETQFLTAGDWNFGSAISLIMAVIIMVSLYITRKIDTDPAAERGGSL